MDIRFVVGVIGNLTAWPYSSPQCNLDRPTFIDIVKKKSVQEYRPDPYLASVICCGMWVFYGMPFIHPDSILVVTTNACGLAFELAYVLIFFLFSPIPSWRKMTIALIAELVFAVTLIVCTLKLVHGTGARTIVVGSVCVALNIIMYTAPLTVMRTVIKTKSVQYMPLPLALGTFANGALWLTYALIKFDPWIMIPNLIGTISGSVQIVLYAMYYKTTKAQDEEMEHELAHIPVEP